MGYEAKVISRISGSLRDAPFASPLHTAAAAADQFLVKDPSFEAPISLYRDRLSQQLADALKDVDVIHLHWPHGLINLDALGEIAGGRPVIWTLHDMAAFTGVCHYSLGCERFTSGCESCPAVRSPFHGAVRQRLTDKAAAIEGIDDLRIVTPSHWLAGEAARSSVLAGRSIRVIPNPLALPPETDVRREGQGHLSGLPDSGSDPGEPERVRLLVLAANLEDPLKGVADAVDGFHRAFPDGQGATLQLVGRGHLGDGTPGVVSLGYQPASEVSTLLQMADYLIVASRAENQPLAIAEAQAKGVSIIGRNAAGIPEHLEIDPEGALFDSVESLADSLAALTPRSPLHREQLARRARLHFDPLKAAKAYEEVYLGS